MAKLLTLGILLGLGLTSQATFTSRICEWSSGLLRCSAGQLMRVVYASYGRRSRSICSNHNTANTNCHAGSSMSVVKRHCENRQSCSLQATNGWFGDPCHGIFKYLEVRFECITIDPCLTQYLREDNWQRSIKYNASSNTPKHCDDALSNKWFRFVSKAGKMMPTSCPEPYACGTEGPVWLNGVYPTQAGQKLSVPVCTRSSTKCCHKTWNIEVKKCQVGNDAFFLHRLPSVPECPMSYCAGTEIPCPPGYNSKTGYTPGCIKLFPPFFNVRMYYGIAEKRIQFTCEFSSIEVNETDIFEVTWWQGAPAQQINQIDILRGSERKAVLRNKHRYPEQPLFYLGTTISCRVRSWFEQRNQTKSKQVESNHFFAGIKVYPEQLKFRLSEGGAPLKLMIRNTVPIVCEKFDGCFVIVEIGQTSSDTLVDVCSVKFEPGKANQTKEVQIVALRDFVNDGDHTMFVKFHVFDHIDPVDWNLHKKIPDVQIMSEDVGTERCTTTGDPHLTTFDKFYYHHYQVGDYVLVNSTCRKFEVHVRTWKCASVSCNCGVAAREGDDVVVVDMCRDKIPRARFASTVQPHPDTKLQRNRNGKSFEISFPSGAFVRVDMHRWYGNLWYANIQVQVVSDDYKCTEGLCGTFDGDKANELKDRNGKVVSGRHGSIAPKQFTESWKIPTGKSLFYYRGGPRKCQAKRVKHYCSCKEDCCGKRQINCDFTGFQKRPKYKRGMKEWKDLNFPGGKHCGRRKRRSTKESIILPDDEDVLTDYVYDPEPINPIMPQWPTPAGKTMAQTRDFCDRELRNSDIAKICFKLIDGFDVTDFVTECVSDIQISDNNTFVMSAIERMKNFCEEKSLKDLTIWQKDPTKNGTLEPPTAVENALCPNQCSGQGICANATCECNSGYETADCSMKKGEQPLVMTKWPQQLDSLCDIRKRDCSRVRVSGQNFIESDNLQCKVKFAKLQNGKYVLTGDTRIYDAFLLSFAEVMCEIDEMPMNIDRYGTGESGIAVGAMFISVANNAQNYSHSQSIHAVYDSKCMNCSLNETCYLQANKCLINGFCFNEDETSPINYCDVCKSTENNEKFTIRKAHLAPVITTKSKWIALPKKEVQIQVEAHDPENQTISFNLKENYEGVSMSKDGLLRFKPDEIGMKNITVTATDKCGKHTSRVLKVNVLECGCDEGETCNMVQNSTKSFIECICPNGCTGPLCKYSIPGQTCNYVAPPSKVIATQSNSTAVIISAAVGGLLLIAAVTVAWYLISKRRKGKSNKTKEEQSVMYSKDKSEAKMFENNMFSSTTALT